MIRNWKYTFTVQHDKFYILWLGSLHIHWVFWLVSFHCFRYGLIDGTPPLHNVKFVHELAICLHLGMCTQMMHHGADSYSWKSKIEHSIRKSRLWLIWSPHTRECNKKWNHPSPASLPLVYCLSQKAAEKNSAFGLTYFNSAGWNVGDGGTNDKQMARSSQPRINDSRLWFSVVWRHNWMYNSSRSCGWLSAVVIRSITTDSSVMPSRAFRSAM